MKRIILPDPCSPLDCLDKATVVNGGGFSLAAGTTGWGANVATFLPVTFPCDVTLYSIAVRGANTTGNYDIGLYDKDLNLLASKGSTAMASAVLSLTLPELRVRAGELLYAAFVTSSTSSSIYRYPGSTANGFIGVGMGQQASALPLPSTASPATMAASTAACFVFGVR